MMGGEDDRLTEGGHESAGCRVPWPSAQFPGKQLRQPDAVVPTQILAWTRLQGSFDRGLSDWSEPSDEAVIVDLLVAGGLIPPTSA